MAIRAADPLLQASTVLAPSHEVLDPLLSEEDSGRFSIVHIFSTHLQLDTWFRTIYNSKLPVDYL